MREELFGPVIRTVFWDRHCVQIHRQPGGEVVFSTRLPDGRLARVCGGRADRGCAVAEELARLIAWSKRQNLL